MHENPCAINRSAVPLYGPHRSGYTVRTPARTAQVNREKRVGHCGGYGGKFDGGLCKP